MALLRACEQLAAIRPAASGGGAGGNGGGGGNSGGGGTCTVSSAPQHGSEPAQMASGFTECIHVLLDTLQYGIGLLPLWAASLVRSPGSGDATPPADGARGTALGSGKALESVAGRILSTYQISRSLGPSHVRVADATKAVTMQLLIMLQQMAA